MTSKVDYLLEVRAGARRVGDVGLERAVTADLARHGHTDPPSVVAAAAGPAPIETTAVELPERAAPEPAGKRRGRPPRPRCEHDRIVGRCVECGDDDAPLPVRRSAMQRESKGA